MKKTIYIILLIVLGFQFNSCTYQEVDIFSASSADRLNQAKKDDMQSLQSAENGWAMEYFATDKSAGYTLLVKFDKSGQAIVAGKNELTNNAYTSDSSLYDMISDNGPVLTFNTYNKILHTFSNPINPNGYGLQGDYEFVVMKINADQIILQGKKRGTTILLNKIPQNITWQNYFAELEAMNAVLFGNNAPKLSMYIVDTKYWFSEGLSHNFTVLKDGADVNIAIYAPFIVTRTGIRFHSAQEINGKCFQTLTLVDDKSSLISVENADLKLLGPDDLADYFSKNINVWDFDTTKISPKLKITYDILVQSCITKYNADEVKLAIKYSSSRKSFELTLIFMVKKSKYEGNLDLNLTVGGKDDLSFLYKSTSDNNGKNFYANLFGYKEMVNLISTGFNLSTTTAINPKSIKFKQKTDADTWFTLNCQ